MSPERSVTYVSERSFKDLRVLVVCATHEEIGHVTAVIRAERTRAGELGQAVRLNRYVPLNWTTAQKSDARNFREGQMLEFHLR